MQHKGLFLFGFLFFIQVASGSEECSWSDEERNLNCCPKRMSGLPEHVMKKCAEEYGLEPVEVPVDYFIPCVEECILKAEGYLSADNRINTRLYRKGAMKSGKLDKLSHCLEEQSSWAVPEGECTSGASLFSHCRDAYEYLHCSGWKDSEECNATREKLTRCYDKRLMPPNTIGLKAK